MRSRSIGVLPVLACAAVVALPACGGSGGGSSSAASNGSTASSTKPTAKGASSKFCKSLTTSLNDTKSLTTDPVSGQPSDLKALVDKARKDAGTIVAAAPDAIKNDVRTLVNASTTYYDALSAANYDLRKVDITKLKPLTSTDVQQASQRVTVYIQSDCGIDVGATP